MPKRKKRKLFEGIEIIRHYDCYMYPKCLNVLVKRNMEVFSCKPCPHYKKDPNWNEVLRNNAG